MPPAGPAPGVVGLSSVFFRPKEKPPAPPLPLPVFDEAFPAVGAALPKLKPLPPDCPVDAPPNRGLFSELGVAA